MRIEEVQQEEVYDHYKYSIWETRYCKWCKQNREFARTSTDDMCGSCRGA